MPVFKEKVLQERLYYKSLVLGIEKIIANVPQRKAFGEFVTARLPAKNTLRHHHQRQCESRDHYFPDRADRKRFQALLR